MQQCGKSVLILCALYLGMTQGPAPADAQGFGSFALCYERLKQLVALLGAQGQAVDETVDEPIEKRYRVVTRFGDRERIMVCTAKGDLLVEDG